MTSLSALTVVLQLDRGSADGDAGDLAQVEDLAKEDVGLAMGHVTVRRDGASSIALCLYGGPVGKADGNAYPQQRVRELAVVLGHLSALA